MDGWDAWDLRQYALLDFGHGRKLERLGGLVLDRPCPAANGIEKREPALWNHVDIRLDERGQPVVGGAPPADWSCKFGDVRFKLKLTPFGHVGVFPEQFQSWHCLRTHVTELAKLRSNSRTDDRDQPILGLNLFAYTGGTTLALAAAGVQVVHVDASTPAVAWARENAEASNMRQQPVRWIVEDVRKFVSRELRRGNRYDVIALDPPSYGHGPTGRVWEIAHELPALIQDCLQLLKSQARACLLLTAHCSTPNAAEVVEMLRSSARLLGLASQAEIERGRLHLQDQAGRELDMGFFARYVDAS